MTDRFASLLPEVQSYLDAVRATGATPTEQQPTVDAARKASRERRMRMMPTARPMVGVVDLALPGPAGPIPVRCYRPTDTVPGCVVWFHGGGWVLDDLDGTDAEASRVAVETGCLVVSVGYRLAPEHPFPAGLDDCSAAAQWVYDHAAQLRYPAGQVSVGGISSGANLAAVVAQERARHGLPPVRAQILVVGIFDAALASESWRQFGSGYLLDRTTCEWFLQHYLGAAGRVDDPRVSPLLAVDLDGQPRALVVTAGFDPLRDDGRAYAKRLAGAGVDVVHEEFDAVIHGFIGPLGEIEPSERAFALIGSFVRASLSAIGTSPGHGRLPWLRPEELSTEARQLREKILGGPRAADRLTLSIEDADGRLEGPFNAMLTAPAVGDALQELGVAIRRRTALSERVREIATLTVADACESDFEWYAHTRLAAHIGLTPEEVSAIGARRTPDSFSETERVVHETTQCLVGLGDLPDAEFLRAVAALETPQLAELITLVGYYQLLAMAMRVWRTPLPKGA